MENEGSGFNGYRIANEAVVQRQAAVELDDGGGYASMRTHSRATDCTPTMGLRRGILHCVHFIREQVPVTQMGESWK